MVWLANFALKGYSQAVFSISLTLLLAVVFPPLFWVSSALLGLLIYNRNDKEILQIVIFVLIFSFLVLQFSLGSGLVAIALALLWLPVSIAVYIAKRFNAYSLGIEVLVLLALTFSVATVLIAGDLQHYWKDLITQLLTQQNNQAPEEQVQLIVDSIGTATTGWIISGAFLGSVLSYLLSGFWCKVLGANDKIQIQFGNLRFSKMLSLGGIAVLMASLSKWLVFENMVPTVIVGFSFVGIAIIHQLILLKTKKATWLIGFYFLLVLLYGQFSLILAMLGLTDYWFHYRNKLIKNT